MPGSVKRPAAFAAPSPALPASAIPYSTQHLSILHHAAAPSALPSSSIRSLGNLSALPAELLFDILSQLDLATLRTLSSISAQASSLTSALTFYQFLLRECPSLVNIILATGVASHYPLPKLKELLSTRSCAFCGQNGTLLLLARAERCCEVCLSGKEAEVVNSRWIAERYNLTESELDLLPQVQAQPGSYAGARGQFTLSAPAPSPLVSMPLAKSLFSNRACSRNPEEVDPHLALLPTFPAPQAEHAFLPAPGLHPPRGSPAIPRVMKLLAPAYANMCATPLPWVCEGSMAGRKWRIDTPVHCVGCLHAANVRNIRRHRWKVWSLTELSEHYQECSRRMGEMDRAILGAYAGGLNVPAGKLLAV